jgi:hypothetical protein
MLDDHNSTQAVSVNGNWGGKFGLATARLEYALHYRVKAAWDFSGPHTENPSNKNRSGSLVEKCNSPLAIIMCGSPAATCCSVPAPWPAPPLLQMPVTMSPAHRPSLGRSNASAAKAPRQ